MNDELYQALEEQMRVLAEINELNTRSHRKLLRLIRAQKILIIALVFAITLNIVTLLYRMLA